MKSQPGIRVLLSSRNAILRAGFRQLLEGNGAVRVVGEATSTQQAMRETSRLHANVVLMDADMGGAATLRAIQEMKASNADIHIWVCSLWENKELIAACLKAGATGALENSLSTAGLHKILAGDSHAPTHAVPVRRSRMNVNGRIAAALVIAFSTFCAVSFAQGIERTEDAQGNASSETAAREVIDEEVDELEEQQEEPQNLRGFFFSTPFSASAVRETRLPREREKLDDFGAAISLPEMTFATVSPRADFSFSYHPSFERFSSHSELNSATHTANFHFAYDIKRRWVFSLKDSFLRTDDPARKLRESIFLLPRTSYQENVLSASLDFLRTARTKYSLEASNTFSYLSLRNLAHILPADRFDQVGGALTASIVHRLSAKERLTGSYSFLMFREMHTGVENHLRRAHNTSALYEYGWDQRGVRVELSGGMLHGSSTSYNALVRLGYNWRIFNVYTGYSRQFAFVRTLGTAFDGSTSLQGALSPESIAQVVVLGMSTTVKEALILDLAAIGGKGAAAIPGNEIRSLSARAQVAYRIGRVFPFIGTEFYGQNFNPMIESRMARSRYFAGLAISLSPVAEAANAPVGDYAAKWPLSAPGLAPRRPSKLERGELK